jgi:hypothetical protein
MAKDTVQFANQESNPMRFVRCRITSGYEAMILSHAADKNGLSGLAATDRIRIMSFENMVARDGVEPPTSAFSELTFPVFPTLQGLPWDCQTLESTSKAVGSWVIAVGDQ